MPTITTITTVIRLADDSTAPITIRRRGQCCQWSAVTIDDKRPYICKRGHIVIGSNAALHIVKGKAYARCRACERRRDRMRRQRQRGAIVTRKGMRA